MKNILFILLILFNIVLQAETIKPQYGWKENIQASIFIQANIYRKEKQTKVEGLLDFKTQEYEQGLLLNITQADVVIETEEQILNLQNMLLNYFEKNTLGIALDKQSNVYDLINFKEFKQNTQKDIAELFNNSLLPGYIINLIVKQAFSEKVMLAWSKEILYLIITQWHDKTLDLGYIYTYDISSKKSQKQQLKDTMTYQYLGPVTCNNKNCIKLKMDYQSHYFPQNLLQFGKKPLYFINYQVIVITEPTTLLPHEVKIQRKLYDKNDESQMIEEQEEVLLDFNYY